LTETVPAGAHWVRFPRFFGDAMMIHGAIAPLREAGLPLVAWGPGWILDLFQGSADYAAMVADPGRKYSPWKASQLLRSHRPASLINFPKSNRPMLAAFLAGVPLRLGCGDGGASLFYTHSIAFYKQDTAFVDRYRSVVARAFPALPEPARFRAFRPRPEVMAEVAARRADLGLGDYVVLAPGANSSSKRLAMASFAALASRLLRSGLTPLILGAGAEDERLALEIRARVPQALDFTSQGGLALAAAWIAGARALVGMDSGLAHIAAGCGIPTLAVFGPTRPRHSAPWGPRVRVLRREDLSCLECMTFDCPLADHPCMAGLSEGHLWDELLAVMNTPASDPAGVR
jgi:ADP-heptose:LPS heptosyltransferase